MQANVGIKIDVRHSALQVFLFGTSRLLNQLSSVLVWLCAFEVSFSVDPEDLIGQIER